GLRRDLMMVRPTVVTSRLGADPLPRTIDGRGLPELVGAEVWRVSNEAVVDVGQDRAGIDGVASRRERQIQILWNRRWRRTGDVELCEAEMFFTDLPVRLQPRSRLEGVEAGVTRPPIPEGHRVPAPVETVRVQVGAPITLGAAEVPYLATGGRDPEIISREGSQQMVRVTANHRVPVHDRVVQQHKPVGRPELERRFLVHHDLVSDDVPGCAALGLKADAVVHGITNAITPHADIGSAAVGLDSVVGDVEDVVAEDV